MAVEHIASVSGNMAATKEIAWGWRLGGRYTALPGCPHLLSPLEQIASSGAWRPALATLQPQLHHLQVCMRSEHHITVYGRPKQER